MSGPQLRRVQPLTRDLVFERSVVHDDDRGVYILHARARLKAPTTEQIEVYKRLEEQRFNPRPIVVWHAETLLQRLTRLRNRLQARRRTAQAVAAQLNGVSA